MQQYELWRQHVTAMSNQNWCGTLRRWRWGTSEQQRKQRRTGDTSVLSAPAPGVETSSQHPCAHATIARPPAIHGSFHAAGASSCSRLEEGPPGSARAGWRRWQGQGPSQQTDVVLRREDRKQRCKVWGNTNRHDREVCTPVANWSRVSVCQVEIPYPHQNRAAVESQCSGCVCESAVSLFVSAIRSLPANSHASLGAAKSTLEFMVGWGDRSSVSTVHTPRHAA